MTQNTHLKELRAKYSSNVDYGLIQKYLKSIDGNNHQPQGRDPAAGLKHSSTPTPANRDSSRIPRSRGVVVQVPFCRGGRRSHPLRVEKNIKMHLNIKQKKQAQVQIMAHAIHSNVVVCDFECFENTKSAVSYIDSIVKSDLNFRFATRGKHTTKRYSKTICVLYSCVSSIKNLRNIPNISFCNISEGNRMYNAVSLNRTWNAVLVDDVTLELINKQDL
jgi:ribosomal protein L4